MKFGALTSSTGSGLSLTVKSIAISLMPVIKNLFGVEIANEDVNSFIDAAWVLGSAIAAIYGYARAKRTPA